ncbi:xanthine dehydrogenase small subunit [Rhodovulum euryhalinum]|uniref:Xanthine dehydrogenase small subunit n=1 Tax=Rhodovulum euryhalinum TaxID=35805 RepID=A0A4R2KNS9_9RHOB|nr:xanthine dehydrogenase small subunit [Rhodovulum euryhalinum]TCO71728.1 xanthine dehydrogenase small subunit [Rhodovulum euryhalinum]
MDERREIRFLLNAGDVRLAAVAAEDTLLDFLRLDRRLTGTKEGCAEGDCGACTVLVGRLSDGRLVYEPVNACIRLMPSLDGCHVVTVEHLAGPGGGLHPVQAAMVAHHGSQCGFCTPGIVMALAALWMETPAPDEARIETALQGNLCRCTGYAPILRAAKSARDFGDPADDPLVAGRAGVAARLAALRDGRRVEVARGDSRAILPADLDDFAALFAAHPEATVVAGATDVGLWVTKGLKRIGPALFIGHLDALRRVDRADGALRIGAGASYAEVQAALVAEFPHLGAYWDRIGGPQVRAMGTVGGNIANGSPIGDTPPVLIALGAEVVLRRGDARRVLPLEAFFLDYGKQDRAPGEFVEAIRVPLAAPGVRHAAYKVSKRRDEDISSVAAGFSVTVEGGTITGARLAFGGMAGVPKRAAQAEAALVGRPWAEATVLAAAKELPRDFTPLTDWRASAAYRMRVAQNLLRRFWLEQEAGPEPARLERA